MHILSLLIYPTNAHWYDWSSPWNRPKFPYLIYLQFFVFPLPICVPWYSLRLWLAGIGGVFQRGYSRIYCFAFPPCFIYICSFSFALTLCACIGTGGGQKCLWSPGIWWSVQFGYSPIVLHPVFFSTHDFQLFLSISLSLCISICGGLRCLYSPGLCCGIRYG